MNRKLLLHGRVLPNILRAHVLHVSLASRNPYGARFATTIIEPAFWRSLIPKPMRRSETPSKKKPRSKEWNPATFFIVVFLLIGSMSINLISVKQDYATFMRQSDSRIGVLRGVVEKLQRGEDVDVEGLLGTGDAQQELEWEDVIRDIEKEEAARPPKRRRTDPKPAPDTDTNSSAAEGNTEIKQHKVPSTSRATFF